MLKHINDREEFKAAIAEGTVLVDFFATWCGPCKMLGKELEEVENDINIDIIKIDIDKYPELAREYKIMSVPTVLLFNNNEVIKQNIGFMDKNKILEFIK